MDGETNVLREPREDGQKCEIRTEAFVPMPRLLIPLNVCRKGTLYMPWECENERHAYEKCVCTHTLLIRQLTFDFVHLDASTTSEYRGSTNFLRVANRGFLQLYAPHEGALEEETRRVRVTKSVFPFELAYIGQVRGMLDT